MDRTKIQKAAKLEGNLITIEKRIKNLEEYNTGSYLYDLTMGLSKAGFSAVMQCALHEAHKDRNGLEAEIAEL